MTVRHNLILCLTLLAGTGAAQSIIVDNTAASFTGSWSTGTSSVDKYGSDYRYASSLSVGPDHKASAVAAFEPNLPQTGTYNVSVWHPAGGNRAADALFNIYGDLATSSAVVNQQINGGTWNLLGPMHFASGTGGRVTVSNSASPTNVMADAVKFDLLAAGGLDAAHRPEFRGMWISRFEWPKSSQAATFNYIDTTFTNLRNANFNAVFMQIRGQMDVAFPSPNEPWSSSFSFTNPGYDPLSHAVTKAHQVGMQFHAYINTHAIWQGSSAPPSNTIPIHPFWTHGNPGATTDANKDWCYYESPGVPQALGTGEDNYVWAAPGVPTFQKWVRDQIMYVAGNYDVDGVHFDRIRVKGNGSYDPISIARQASVESNPEGLDYRTWNQDQITRFVSDVYGAIAELNYNTRLTGKPRVAASCAPFPTASSQLGVNQDLNSWMFRGAMDFYCPQCYTADTGTFLSELNSHIPNANGRYLIAGMSRNTAGSTPIIQSEVQIARNRGAFGNLVFSVTGFSSSEIASYATSVFPTFVNPPAFPWVVSPEEAIIVGTATDASTGQPILDAQIKRTGWTYTWLSGTDGFYAILKVPANTNQSVVASKSGFPPKTVSVPALAPGEVRRVNIPLGFPAKVDNWFIY